MQNHAARCAGDKGDKWETSVKSCRQRPERPTCAERGKWETSVKSCGPEQWETRKTSGRQVQNHVARSTESALGDKRDKCHCNIMRPKQPQCGRNASPETNVKSCGPGMQPFQRSKNPSQVNLFGE